MDAPVSQSHLHYLFLRFIRPVLSCFNLRQRTALFSLFESNLLGLFSSLFPISHPSKPLLKASILFRVFFLERYLLRLLVSVSFIVIFTPLESFGHQCKLVQFHLSDATRRLEKPSLPNTTNPHKTQNHSKWAEAVTTKGQSARLPNHQPISDTKPTTKPTSMASHTSFDHEPYITPQTHRKKRLERWRPRLTSPSSHYSLLNPTSQGGNEQHPQQLL